MAKPRELVKGSYGWIADPAVRKVMIRALFVVGGQRMVIVEDGRGEQDTVAQRFVYTTREKARRASRWFDR